MSYEKKLFRDSGSDSSLRAESIINPRICRCPQCGAENALTVDDARHGYVCDRCADRAERGGY